MSVAPRCSPSRGAWCGPVGGWNHRRQHQESCFACTTPRAPEKVFQLQPEGAVHVAPSWHPGLCKQPGPTSVLAARRPAVFLLLVVEPSLPPLRRLAPWDACASGKELSFILFHISVAWYVFAHLFIFSESFVRLLNIFEFCYVSQIEHHFHLTDKFTHSFTFIKYEWFDYNCHIIWCNN